MGNTSRGGRAILNLIIYLPLVFSTDCGIDFGNDSPFAFTEIRENTTVGTSLGNFSATNIIGLSLSPPLESSFISVSQNEDKTGVDFILSRPLTEYRTAAWSPSIEIDVTVNCTVIESGNGGGGYSRYLTSVKCKTYKFMSLIEDCNLYAPTFNASSVEFNFTYPWAADSPLNKEPIKVSDFDFNKAYANITVECVSPDCQYFKVETSLTSSNVKGHNYDIFVYPKEDIKGLPKMKEGTVFSLNLTAKDESHNSSMMVSFVTAKIANTQQESDSPFPKSTIAIIGGSLGLISTLLGAAWGYTWYRGGSAKRALRKLTETEIREFMEGTVGFGEWIGKRSIDVNMPIIAKPYNKAVDIPRDNLKIDETSILGTGFFGVVMKGVITRPNGETSVVAVKKVKRNVGVVYFKALLSELKIMAHLGDHPNIVKLIGACTHNIRKREVFIAVEFCANGNLHNFLLKSRGNFINMVRNGQLCGVSDNVGPNEDLGQDDTSSCSKALSTLHLLKWSFQIASGLEYLGSKMGVIHGDLATRNILLDSENVAKIADFGLSRRLVDASNYYYTKQAQAVDIPRPWKWMAPETLRDMKFSTQSDIWSFGVVLWEIFTMGQIPYPTVNWSENFVRSLEEGVRLGQPAYASDSIYEIMQDCWTEEPADRPVAHDIKAIFGDLINKLLQQTEDEGYMKVMGDEHPLYIGDLARTQKLEEQDSQYHSEIEDDILQC